jgi:gliding motility-associated-like protein
VGNDYDNTGTWQVVSGDATLINNNEFDPTSVELIGENASVEITFSYTLPNSSCRVEATLEVHNRCAVLACGDEDLVISKVVTPNGDFYNEYFEVLGVEDCDFIIDLKIVNRWGAIVFESNDYQNNWNGFVHNGSLGSANQVPSGTYYYIVSLKNSGLKPKSGPVYIGTK